MERSYKILIVVFLIWAVSSTSALAYYYNSNLNYKGKLHDAELRLEKYRDVIVKMNNTLNALNNTLIAVNKSYSEVISNYSNIIGLLEEKLNMSVAIFVIDYGNGTKDIIKVEFMQGVNDTVFDLLKNIAKINYTYYESYGDVMINCINGVCNKQLDSNSGYYWLFYINFLLSQVGAMHAMVRDGDIVIWNYTKLTW
jgi:hypothetical protein